MTGSLVKVDAQWALYGKNADSDGYHILACSTGSLSRENFADALSRFQLGELTTLPQVAVSYARLGSQPGMDHLALAIDDFASGGPRTRYDRNGRKITYTSYFCVPYRPVAELAIGYLTAYEALRAVTLPQTGGPPLPITLTAPTARILAVDPLAMRVAALLLTGHPVCVIGADVTRTDERLRFLDSVMDLLPYGLRARMAAATWTRATHAGHRFRLFFSSAPRPGTEQDHVVTWGEAERVLVPAGPAAEYLSWLEDNVGPLSRLAELISEMSFGAKDARQVLEIAARSGIVVRAPVEREPSPAALVSGDVGEEVLLDCAEHVRLTNLPRLRSDIKVLRTLTEHAEITEDRSKRYRELIEGHGLLGASEPIGKLTDMLYDALLPMAFGTPLDYEAYCWVETCAGVAHGDAPHRGLLMAIVRAGMADDIVSAIVYWHLRETDENKLSDFLASRQTDAVRLIDQLAHEWTYAQHARIFCDVTLECLRKTRGRYQARQVRDALRRHGFLAHALQLRHPDKEQYQARALYRFLRAAYPGGLDRSEIVRVLAGSGHPPTAALFAAVVMVAKAADRPLASEAYIDGSLKPMKLGSALASRLDYLLPTVAGEGLPNPVEESPGPDSVEPSG